MKHWRVIIICIIISGIGILLMSCAPRYVWKSTCGHTSVYATMVVDDHPTRIAHGYVSESYPKDVAHTQAEYFRDGKWRRLQVVIWAEVIEGDVDYEMRGITYISGHELMLRYYTDESLGGN